MNIFGLAPSAADQSPNIKNFASDFNQCAIICFQEENQLSEWNLTAKNVLSSEESL